MIAGGSRRRAVPEKKTPAGTPGFPKRAIEELGVSDQIALVS
jgi:hypothetical protein